MTADQLRKSILQQAIQGKLVPQDPNDEPASALLERIREEKARLVKENKIKKEKNPSVIFRGEDNSHYEKFILTGEVKCIDDEIPFELPNGWEWCRLGEISTYAQKKRKINALNADSQMWGLDLEDIKRGGYLLRTRTIRERVSIGYKTIFKGGDILYCKLRPYLLKILIAPKDGICTPEIIPFTCYGSICNEYIVSYLKSPYVDDFINSVTFGVKMPRVSTDTITSLFVPLPPLSEQQRIVAKIEELMPLVEQYGKAQSELEVLNTNIREQLKKSILEYAIEGKLVAQCEEDGTAEDLLQEIQAEKQRLYAEGKLKKKDLTHSPIFRGEDNKYYEQIGKEVICIDEEIPFEIPVSWRWVRVQNIGEIITGGTPAKDTPSFYGQRYPLYKPSDLAQGDDTRLATDMLSEKGFMRVRQLPMNSILVSCIGSLGKVGLIKEVGSCNQQINAIIPFKVVNPKFLYLVCISNSFQTELQNRASSTTIQIVNKSRFSEILLPIPPILEQQRIATSITQIIQLIEG